MLIIKKTYMHITTTILEQQKSMTGTEIKKIFYFMEIGLNKSHIS